MDDADTQLADLGNQLSALAAEIEGHCRIIATDLARLPDHSTARITASEIAITQLVHRFFQFLPSFQQAQITQARMTETSAGERRIIPPDWLAMNAQVGLLRNAINRWSKIQALVHRQVPPRAVPLYADTRQIDPLIGAQTIASDRLFDQLHGILNPTAQSDNAVDYGCYPDIGLSNSVFLAHVHAAHRLLLAQGKVEGTRFLDVGCGGGLKLLAAAQFFRHVDGIEYDAGFAARARDLLEGSNAPACRVLEQDALTFEDYSVYDVIYFYRPMRHPEILFELEQRIAGDATPGTILIAPYDQFEPHGEDLGCAHVAGRIWIAGMSADEATQLRTTAEHMGLEPPRRAVDLPDIWEPVLSVSGKRGYGL